jgi:rfaE bifunctional protein nucleotidyltransferase chain/domain
MRTVLAHGVFDLLHLGHIRHLQEAKALGDRLVVSVTADPYVNKGAGRPHFTQAQRMEALRALDCVDDVVLARNGSAVDVINDLKPAIYVKGIDYEQAESAPKGLAEEVAAVEAAGGRFAITRSEKWSSSRILNAEKFDDRTLAYLEQARHRGFRDAILAAFERADKLKLAFVGESIIDEYRYVATLGKSSKEPTLATVQLSSEAFEGGVTAAARHGEWCNVKVVSAAKPLRKTRYVDADFNRKLFEVYDRPRLELIEPERAKLQADLNAAVRDCDVLVVVDFGHGLLGLAEQRLLRGAKYLGVNAQSNAGNYGFNPVTRYQAAHYVCIDDPEARLATGMQTEPIEEVGWSLGHLMRKAKRVITRGRHGALACWGVDNTAAIPAFAAQPLDTMGAGDAFLAVTAPLVAAGLKLEPAAFVGNVAGAIKVGIVGHRRHVGRQELVQTVETLLK